MDRYVDDTFSFIRKGCVDDVLEVLNSFHASIKFTFEKERDNTLSFLDVKVIKKLDGSFDTDIHRKKTDTNIYMNWNSFAPKAWKVGTLKSLLRRAYTICSNDSFVSQEISFLKTVFRNQNGFPSRVVNETIENVKRKVQEENNSRTAPVVPEADIEGDTNDSDKEVTPYICLQYKGKEGEIIVSKFRDALKGLLPRNVKPRITFRGKKIGSFFRLKDKVPVEHQTNLIYRFRHDGVTKYIGQTNVRYGTRTNQHCHSDKLSSVYKYIQEGHHDISEENFDIIDKGYPKKWNRRLAEALYVKDFKPELNGQAKSTKLLLFN